MRTPLVFEEQLGFLLHRTDLLLTAHARARLAALDVAPEQNLVLLLLADRQPLTPGEIATALEKDKTTVARHLATLDDKGWVRRRPVAGDRRSLLVELTEVGARLADRAAPVAARLQQDLVDGIDAEELAAFTATLRKLRHNLTLRTPS